MFVSWFFCWSLLLCVLNIWQLGSHEACPSLSQFVQWYCARSLTLQAYVWWFLLPHVPQVSVVWGHCAAKCDVLNFWHLRHLLASCRSLRVVTQVLARRVPILIRLFAEDLDRRCKMRWAVDWLTPCFSGSLIHHAVVMLPGCNEFVLDPVPILISNNQHPALNRVCLVSGHWTLLSPLTTIMPTLFRQLRSSTCTQLSSSMPLDLV